ncbi:MAG: hypothetical protein V3U92_10800 [Cellulophaga sp.]
MSEFAHIFTPQNDSLSERVRSYRKVFEAFKNVEVSLKYTNNKSRQNQLGEKKEVEDAYEITEQSLQLAIKSFNNLELDQLKEQNIMSDSEVLELVKLKRKQEVKELREGFQESNTKDYQRK